MARVSNNLVVQGMSGSLEKKILLKHYGNITLVTAFPDRSMVKITDSQKKENGRFRVAMAYARSQMADPASKAEYQAIAKGLQRAHNMAIADFYQPPEIKSIDFAQCKGRINDPISIVAVDLLKVVKLTVSIMDVSGRLLESGDALMTGRWKWEYRLTNNYSSIEQMTAKVTAWDKPGNSAECCEALKNKERR